MPNIKLRSALNMTSLFSIFLPILVISIVSLKFTGDFILEKTMERNEQVANQMVHQLEVFFDEPVKYLKFYSGALDVMQEEGPVDKDELIHLLLHTYEIESVFDQFALLDRSARVIDTLPSNPKLADMDYSQQAVIKQLIAKPGDIAWSPTYVTSLGDKAAVDAGIVLGDYFLVGTLFLERLGQSLDALDTGDGTLVAITDTTGVYVAHSDMHFVKQRVTDPIVNLSMESAGYTDYFGEKMAYTRMPLTNTGWHVMVYEPYQTIYKVRDRYIWVFSIVLMASFAGIIFMANQNNARIEKHFTSLLNSIKKVAAGKYLPIEDEVIFKEFKDIITEFNKMTQEIKVREEEISSQREEMEAMNEELENRISDRTNKLIKANLTLEKTLDDLKATQQQLIESEKMASLGSLVAGVAHEINTPIGVTMTAITYLIEEGQQLKAKFETDELGKKDLTDYLDVFSEGALIIEKNIQKASDLIKSFKLMAVDQSNADVREFELGQYIRDVLFSLEPRIKKSKVTLDLNLEEGIDVYADPGDISQILTNLVMNALIHAFPQNTEGKITIRLSSENRIVHLDVIDNGIGIPEENIHTIFEPFFTTRRGQGGTGLGLNITYNLVTQKLKGSIRCVSEVGIGTAFQIRIPQTIAPHKVTK